MSVSLLQRKKVLFLIGNLGDGGAEKSLKDIVNNLDTDIYDITVMTIINEGINIKKLSPNIHYKSITSQYMTGWDRFKVVLVQKSPFVKLMHKLFIENGYDVEVSFLEGMTAKIISGAENRTRKIAWIHTDISEYPSCIEAIGGTKKARRIYQDYDKICCVSEKARQSMMGELGLAGTKIIVQNNPIDAEKIRKKAEEENLQKEADEFRIIAVGRLTYVKGFDRLIKTVADLKEKYNFSLYIIGEGELHRSIQKMIKENFLEDRITLCGFLENPYPFMKSADLFICSSRVEGFSLVVCEALVLGIPCLSTRCGGPEEILEDGLYGLLVDNSYKGLLNGMKNILEHPEYLSKLKQKSIEGGKKFEFKEAIKNIENILGETE